MTSSRERAYGVDPGPSPYRGGKTPSQADSTSNAHNVRWKRARPFWFGRREVTVPIHPAGSLHCEFLGLGFFERRRWHWS